MARLGQGHFLGLHLDHAEVGDLHAAALRQEDVVGLDVAMDHPLSVGVGQCLGTFDRDADRVGNRDTSQLRHPFLHALPGDILHGDVMATLRLADRRRGDDVRMVEPAHHLAFAVEPFDELLVLGNVREENFEGNGARRVEHDAVDADLFGLVDGPHGAFAELFDQLIIAEMMDVLAQDARRRDRGVIGLAAELEAAARRIVHALDDACGTHVFEEGFIIFRSHGVARQYMWGAKRGPEGEFRVRCRTDLPCCRRSPSGSTSIARGRLSSEIRYRTHNCYHRFTKYSTPSPRMDS